MNFAFLGFALDRHGDAREDASWLQSRLVHRDAQAILIGSQGRVLLGRDQTSLLQIPLGLMQERFAPEQFVFLGQDGDRPYFVLSIDDQSLADTLAIHDAVAAELRAAALSLDPAQAGLAAFATALCYWQSRSRFCGTCGAPTLFSAGGHRALCTRESCGAAFFPRTDPCVIMLVHDGDRMLLGRQRSWPEGRYSTLAGFVEPGEALEAAVRREVLEEAGVRVGECRYIGSQPWPFPASLMLGFFAEARSTAIRVNAELEDARWFARGEVPQLIADGRLRLAPRFSISRHLIDQFLQMGP